MKSPEKEMLKTLVKNLKTSKVLSFAEAKEATKKSKPKRKNRGK